jgi:hypothetical protein
MRNKLSKFYKNKDNFAAHTANHFNHKFYKIVPGKNEFIAPSDMFPFSQININDTKWNINATIILHIILEF